MKGSQKIIDKLNFLLIGELTSMDLYFLHSKIYADMGLTKLHERIAHEMTDEIDHAGRIIDRILFLEGKPDLSKRDAYDYHTDVEKMLKQSLVFEYDVAKNLKEVMTLCEQEKDYVTRELLSELLVQ